MMSRCLVIALLAIEGYPAMADSSHGETDYIVQTLRKAQGMLRQTMEEKLKLEATVTDLEAKLAAQRKAQESELTRVNQALAGKSIEHDKLLALLERLRRENEGAMGKLATRGEALEQKNQGLQVRIGKLETEFKKVTKEVNQKDNQLQRARENQKALIEVTMRLLSDFENQGFWETLTENESLTGIGHVDKENRIDDYRHRLRELEQSLGVNSP